MNKQSKTTSLVSIIMNCHNGEAFLYESVKSILAQTYKNWELIFWDNFSTDNSKQILKKFSDDRIKYFKASRFTTLYEARNLAMAKSEGDFISFLDVDDWWVPQKLELQIKYFQNYEVGLVYSKYFVFNEKNKKKKIISKKDLPQGYIANQLLEDYKMGVITVIFRKELLNRFNLNFNSQYNIIGDFDFNIKLSQRVKCACVQKPLAFYRVHGENYSLKNLDEEVKELEHWTKNQILSNLQNEKSLKKIKNIILYKKIFGDICQNNRLLAVKKILRYPNNFLKLKLIVLLISPISLLRRLNLIF